MPRENISFHILQSGKDDHESIDVDAIVLSEDNDMTANIEIPQAITNTLVHNRQRHPDANSNSNPLILLPTHGLLNVPYLIVVENQIEDARKLGHEIIQLARRERLTKLLLNLKLPANKQKQSNWLQQLAEGMYMANYHRQTYNSQAKSQTFVSQVYLLLGEVDEAFEKALQWAEIVGEAVCHARDLTNLPGNYLVPAILADEVQAISDSFDCFECEVLDEQQIADKGMGGLLAVGKASVNPPRMITVTYSGNPESEEILGLIGKGITFDTGGISLKRSDSMAEMICDMAGAATVAGVMQAVGRLRPKCNLVFVIAAAENMPAGNAYKPGDVITTMSGKTIEVLNTDAEGRVVLADAMTYALQKGASKLIDIATLTGAVLVCLADVATGAVTNNQDFMNQLQAAASEADERIWQLPVYPEYKEMIKSSVADVKNTGGRYAGSITGGLFIGTFADHAPWIHLDVAGTAFLDKQRGIHPKGGTGAMVRTLIEFIKNQ
jgi:leucyl aminopeptidase